MKTAPLKTIIPNTKEIALNKISVVVNERRNKPEPMLVNAADMTKRCDFLISIIFIFWMETYERKYTLKSKL